VRCWQCGVEPLSIVDTTTLGSPFATYTPGRWPPSIDGHEHAETPPTPGQLEQAGHAALMKIRNLASDLA
jgi:hypothetical protein